MGGVERNGRPEPEATGSGPGQQEAAAYPAARQDRAGPATGGAEPAREESQGAQPGAGRSAGDPNPTNVSGAGPDPDAPAVVVATESSTPGTAGPNRPAPGAVGPAAAPSSDHAGQFPPAAGAVPPPGWYPAGPGTPSYGAAPYPQGPYPPVGPSVAAPPTEPAPRGRPSWGAPPPVRTHRWGLGAYLLAEAVFLLVSGYIAVFLIDDAAPTVGTLVVALAVPTMLAAATALLITWVRGNGPRIDLCLEWSWRDVGLGLAFGFGGLALTIPASIIYVAIVGQDASSAVGDVFGGIRAGPVLAMLVLVIVVLIAPACEEILYRGLLWGGVEKHGGRWVAFAVTTLMFALAHFEFTRTPLLLVVAIPIAIARLYTGRLLASIVAHQINNLLPGIVLVLGLLGAIPMA